MIDKLKVQLVIQGKDGEEKVKEIVCPVGISLGEISTEFGSLPSPLAAVKANNEILPLASKLEVNAKVEPVFIDSSEGAMVYRCSLAFLLAAAAKDLFPERSLYIGHSLGRGFYYTFLEGHKPEENDIKMLDNKMRELVQQDLPIDTFYMAYAEAMVTFKKNGQDDTALLLDERSESKVMVNMCSGFIDLYIHPLLSRTGLLKTFELMPYKEGFLLRFPASYAGNVIEPFEDSPKIFAVYEEYKRWGRIVGVHSVGRLNRLVSERTIKDYIMIAEAFQEKKIGDIAEQIYDKRDDVRTVLIAGPSSSGKTTTAKRLSIALKVMGFDPIDVGLDNYYVGTDKTPLDEHGKPDFECLEALDIPYLNEQLLSFLAGDEITLPVFDFRAGKRREEGGRKIRHGRRTILILEGIHGLNDNLTPQIKKENKFKIYISPLTQLNLDDHNRIPTTDNRLLRRMVRDYQFRGAGALRTFDMWPSVNRGEIKHIYPFQNSADVAFNSSLDYELAVLKFYAEPLLRTVKPGMKEYAEASRLLSFLSNFAPIPPQYVPGTSILREFIGESEFKY